MPTYVYDPDKDEIVEVVRGPRPPSLFPNIMRDLPAYMSPLGDRKVIEGRAARREHMKRNNVREVDPSERPAKPATPDWVSDWRANKGITRSKPNE